MIGFLSLDDPLLFVSLALLGISAVVLRVGWGVAHPASSGFLAATAVFLTVALVLRYG